MKRDSFIFYTSWLKGLEDWDEKDQAAAVFAMLRYAAFGEEPKTDNPVVKMAFEYTKPQIDANNKRFLASKKGGAPKGNHNNPKGRGASNHRLNNNQPNVNADEDDEEYDYDDEKVNYSVYAREYKIKPNIPTLEQVKEYVREAGLDIDPEHFWAHYGSIGWVMGNNIPISDWKAAARNWEKHAGQFDY